MCHDFLSRILVRDSKLYPFLAAVDADLAQEARDGDCLRCGGRLHSANYPRKPRGGPADLGEECSTRCSFCCAEEGCRRRLTPPSVRFLGRRVYLGAVVVLVSAMLHGSTPPRAARLHELFGVSPRTRARWRTWWRTAFTEGSFWKMARGLLRSPVDTSRLPLPLWECFSTGDDRERLLALLRFLSSITSASAPNSHPC